jgi:hypothetical protein
VFTRSTAPPFGPGCPQNGWGRFRLLGAAIEEFVAGPQGERNGNYRHGRHTKETKAGVGSLRRLIREVRTDNPGSIRI